MTGKRYSTITHKLYSLKLQVNAIILKYRYILSGWGSIVTLLFTQSIQTLLEYSYLPYFFGYKTEVFFFQNNLKDLDLSYKMDLDLWHCLGKVELIL